MSSLLYTVPFGSQVYGLTNSKSDKDYIYIYSNDFDLTLIPKDDNHMTVHMFQSELNQHSIKALEAYFFSKELQDNFEFKLNTSFLRKRLSAIVSNAHVKAKKKFIDDEVYIGLKSYFHCIRLLTMFTYLAKHGTFNPSSFKYELEYIYLDIINRQKDNPTTMFLELEKDYKKMLKSLQYTFRMYCPKSE